MMKIRKAIIPVDGHDTRFFRLEFLSSLARSLADIKAGRVKKISSLKSLRNFLNR